MLVCLFYYINIKYLQITVDFLLCYVIIESSKEVRKQTEKENYYD